MQLWQIDYDNDDKAWVDLVREQEGGGVLLASPRQQDELWNEHAPSSYRCTSFFRNAEVIPFSYYRPSELTRYFEKRKAIEPLNSTWSAPDSGDQVSREVYYCSYGGSLLVLVCVVLLAKKLLMCVPTILLSGAWLT